MFGFVCEDFLFFLLVSPLPTKRIHKPQNSTYQKWCFRTRRWRNIQLIWSFRRRVLGFLEENTWSGWVRVSLVGWVGRLVALCCVGWLFWLKPLICYPGCPLTLLASPGLWPGHGAEQGSMHCVKWCWWWDEGSLVSLFKTNDLQSKESVSLRDYHVDDVWKWELGNWEGRMAGSPAVRIWLRLEGGCCARNGARRHGRRAGRAVLAPGPWRPVVILLRSKDGGDILCLLKAWIFSLLWNSATRNCNRLLRFELTLLAITRSCASIPACAHTMRFEAAAAKGPCRSRDLDPSKGAVSGTNRDHNSRGDTENVLATWPAPRQHWRRVQNYLLLKGPGTYVCL